MIMKKSLISKTALFALIALLCLAVIAIQPETAASADVDSNYYFEKIEVSIDVRRDKTLAV